MPSNHCITNERFTLNNLDTWCSACEKFLVEATIKEVAVGLSMEPTLPPPQPIVPQSDAVDNLKSDLHALKETVDKNRRTSKAEVEELQNEMNRRLPKDSAETTPRTRNRELDKLEGLVDAIREVFRDLEKEINEVRHQQLFEFGRRIAEVVRSGTGVAMDDMRKESDDYVSQWDKEIENRFKKAEVDAVRKCQEVLEEEACGMET